ncbi:MAG: hypothetical protein ACRDPG_13425, partial [Nocardioidaceae bacterium]
MKLRQCVCVCVTAGALFAAGVGVAGADQFAPAGCNVQMYGIDYNGHNHLFYFSADPQRWELDYTTYDFGPAKSGS